MRILVLLLIIPFFASAQLNPAFVSSGSLNYTKVQSSGEGMFGFEQNGKIGYLDSKGNVVIPATYSYDSLSATLVVLPSFYKGYAKVVKNRKFGLIDKTGKLIIPIEYESITPNTQFGNFVQVYKTISGKKMYGVLTLQNKLIVSMEYEDIRIDTNIIMVKQNSKWGLFDKTGKQLLPFEYTSLSAYTKDNVLKAEKGSQYGFIDLSGKWLFEKTKSVYSLYGCAQGLVTCIVNKKYGYLDLKGNEVIITRYDVGYDFESVGLAKVGNNKPGNQYTNLYGYIDKKGNEVIPLKYESMGIFSNDLVYAKDPETNRFGYFDKTGKWFLKPVYLDAYSFDAYGGAWVKTTDGKFHYINKTGKDFGTFNEAGTAQSFGKDGYAIYENADYSNVLIDKTGKVLSKIDDCETFYAFSDGIAGFKSKTTTKYGFVNLDGNKITSPEFDGYSAFVEGVARVDKKIDGKTKSGYIDNKGNVILPIVYENLYGFRNDWGLLKKDGNYFFIDKNGNLKDAPRKYDDLSEFRSGFSLGRVNGTGGNPNTYYYINAQLKEEFSIIAKEAYLFWENVAIIKRDKDYEMMNKKGEVFKSLTGIETLSFCTEGILAIREKGKWGYMNDKGDIFVSPKYDTCTAFKFGYGRIKLGTKWGILDRSGTEIFPDKYENIFPGENGIFIFYDKAWGVMDRTGKIMVQPSLYTITTFEKDRALARLGKSYTILKSPLLKN
jgi:hypothetical protein